MPPDSSKEIDLEHVLDAVADACRITREVQRRQGEIRQHTKDDRSPVTVADYAAQALIAERLRQRAQPLRLVGEEDAAALREPANRALLESVTEAAQLVWAQATAAGVADCIDLGNHDASADSYWTLDPIDGTKGFLRGGQYAISLALIEGGSVVFGVLGCPNLSLDLERPFDDPDPVGTLFFATRGSGAWTVTADRPGAAPTAIAASGGRGMRELRMCESVESGHSRLDDSARIRAHLDAGADAARLDSQCKYAVVARGQADVYLRMPTRADYVEKIWDHAAGSIIAEEAGAVVTDVTGAALDFSRGSGLSANAGVLCAGRDFHAPVRGAIDALGLA